MEITQEICCKVCIDAGKENLAYTHSTRDIELPDIENHLKKFDWPLIKSIGKSTKCPILMATVCTNPLCFNGKDGLIRYPMFGHSRSNCPCSWPIGWDNNSPNGHLRKNGIYNNPSQFSIAKNNKKTEPDDFCFADFIRTQELLESGNYPYKIDDNVEKVTEQDYLQRLDEPKSHEKNNSLELKRCECYKNLLTKKNIVQDSISESFNGKNFDSKWLFSGLKLKETWINKNGTETRRYHI